jgi:RHS repeat-associated protein
VHTEHLNTPRLVADATGTTVWRWDQQEPFGNNPADEDPDANSVAFDLPLRLPGQRYDAETGLYYNYFRDYDPSLGRYAESDPIGLDGGLDTYAYVDASPLGDADPLGLVKWTGSLTVVDLGVGPKIGKRGPRIPVLRRNQIQLVLESECVAGKKQHATIRALNPESGEWRHLPQTWLRGSVELEDGLSVPDARQLQGTFTLDMFGLFYARGMVSTGRGVGTFSGLGLVGGGYSFRGRSYLLFPPKEESCVCKPKE